MAPRPIAPPDSELSPGTYARYCADGASIISRYRKSRGGQGTTDRDLLVSSGFVDWFRKELAAELSQATWRRYRRALSVYARHLGLPQEVSASLARIEEDPTGTPDSRDDREAIQGGLSAAALRNLRRRIERSDLAPELRRDAVDLLYATVATGLHPDDWVQARLEGRGHRRVLCCPDDGGERQLAVGLLAPWVLERVLAVRRAANQFGWSSRVERIEAALRSLDAKRRSRGQPMIALQSARSQYLTDLLSGGSTANEAAPKAQGRPQKNEATEPGRQLHPTNPSPKGLYHHRPDDLRTGRVWLQIYECLKNGAVEADDHLAVSSCREYKRESNKLLRVRDPAAIWEAIRRTTRPNVAAKRRAALCWRYREEARRLYVLGYQSNWDTLRYTAELQQWQLLRATLLREPPTERRLPAPEVRTPRHSKRALLKVLEDGWEITLAEAVPHQWREAVLVQALTGCRPAELAEGVQVTATDDALIVRIKGKKVTETSGWPWRTMVWSIPPCADECDRIVAALWQGGTRDVFLPASTKRYCQILTRTGQELWPHLPEALTPYVLRQQLASIAKEYWHPEDIAHMLGHRTEKTQSTYGMRRYARGAAAGRLPDVVSVSDQQHPGTGQAAATDPNVDSSGLPEPGM